jgi:hypothetical protein
MKKKSVYIETTIPSYATANPSSDSVKLLRQIITRNFWENERHKYDLYISQYVVEECADGDEVYAKLRLDLIKDIPYLPITEEIEKLAEEYYEFLKIPDNAKTDCFHLAICVINKIDFLMSWNMKHLGQPTYRRVGNFNEKRNLWLPQLLTIDAFMEIMEEEK